MKNLLLTQFDLHHRLFNNVLDGFTDEETNQRLNGDKNINHVKYLAGHLLNSQYGFAMLAGVDVEVKWHNLFAAANQSKARDDVDYPHIDKIKEEWNSLYEATRSGLENLKPETLAETPAPPMDNIFDTNGGMWAFLTHHQAYHIGQIGILRRGFGKEPLRFD